MDHGPRMENSWLAAGLTCIMSWLTNKVQLCCATPPTSVFPFLHRAETTEFIQYLQHGRSVTVMGWGWCHFSNVCWLMARMCNPTAEELVISIHAALLRSAHISVPVSWTKVARPLDTCHCSYVVELWCLEHFMISDDSSIYTGLMVQINLIFRSYSI